MFCCLKKHYECSVCLENKKKIYNCKLCKNAIVCYDCVESMLEKSLCGKCPVCRQKNWIDFKSNQIIPVNSELREIKIEDATIGINLSDKCSQHECSCFQTLNYIKKIFHAFYILGGSIILTYAIGLFTIYIFNVHMDLNANYYLYWLPFLIGLCWIALCWSPCCCGKALNQAYCQKF